MTNKFPRIKAPPKPKPAKKPLKPCLKCGKGLGVCRGGWCQRCVNNWIETTTPHTENAPRSTEMLGRKAFPSVHDRRFQDNGAEQ